MAKQSKKANGKSAVIVRTYSAGVHYGHLVEQSADGKRVQLTGARRVWAWKGANTLHEMALRGVGQGSRVSDRVESITLTEAIEVIGATRAAIEKIASFEVK